MVTVGVGLKFQPDRDVLALLAEALEESPKTVAIAIQREMLPDYRAYWLPRLQQEPPRAVHPFRWAIDRAAHLRAARWWFAAIGRGEIRTDGTGYVRSGDLVKKWRVDFIQTNELVGEVVVSNASPSAGWVYGSDTQRQVPGHHTTGWPLGDDLLLAAAEDLTDRTATVALEALENLDIG